MIFYILSQCVDTFKEKLDVGLIKIQPNNQTKNGENVHANLKISYDNSVTATSRQFFIEIGRSRRLKTYELQSVLDDVIRKKAREFREKYLQ